MNHKLLIEMASLMHQATTEQSHYYTAATLSNAIKEIVVLNTNVELLSRKVEQLQTDNEELRRYTKRPPAGKS
jgi:predicted ATP-grasp superfamily ATP-dependent carboligase